MGVSGPASPAGLTPPVEYLDPISNDVMQDPVVLGDTGNTYERSTISMWLERCARAGRAATDPLTGLVVGDAPKVRLVMGPDGLNQRLCVHAQPVQCRNLLCMGRHPLLPLWEWPEPTPFPM